MVLSEKAMGRASILVSPRQGWTAQLCPQLRTQQEHGRKRRRISTHLSSHRLQALLGTPSLGTVGWLEHCCPTRCWPCAPSPGGVRQDAEQTPASSDKQSCSFLSSCSQERKASFLPLSSSQKIGSQDTALRQQSTPAPTQSCCTTGYF